MKPMIFLPLVGFLSLTGLLQSQNCIPTITVINGISINVIPLTTSLPVLNGGTGAVVNVSDFRPVATNPCGFGPLRYRIRKSGAGFGLPIDTSLTFTCGEVGTNPVEVWVSDAAGNANFVETYVIVADPKNYCHFLPAFINCASDQIPPAITLLNGLAVSLVPNGTEDGTGLVTVSDLVLNVRDNCSGPVEYFISKAGPSASGPSGTKGVFFSCQDLGLQLMAVWAGDASGNWSYAETFVLVEDGNQVCHKAIPLSCSPDKNPPESTVRYGMSVALAPSANGDEAVVNALDFIVSKRDKCNNFLGWRISKEDLAAPTFLTTDKVTFDCSELGMQTVYIWVSDGVGNWNKVKSYILVQDNFSFCTQFQNPEPVLERSFVPDHSPAEVSRFTVLPNPTSGAVRVSGVVGQSGLASIYLYDALGRRVRVLAEQQTLEAGEFQLHFSLDNLPAGVYRCIVKTENWSQTRAVVKE